MKQMYVAVVTTETALESGAENHRSGRSHGDWSAFINEDADAAVVDAMKAKRDWEASGRFGPYVVAVGTLQYVAEAPVIFKLRKLSGGEKHASRNSRRGSGKSRGKNVRRTARRV